MCFGRAHRSVKGNGMFYTVGQVKAANKKIGHKWFSPANMRFFKTHVIKGHYGGRLIQARFFITSDDVWGLGRRFIIRAARDTGEVETVGERKYLTWRYAEKIAERLHRDASPCANCRRPTYNPNYTCDACITDGDNGVNMLDVLTELVNDRMLADEQ